MQFLDYASKKRDLIAAEINTIRSEYTALADNERSLQNEVNEYLLDFSLKGKMMRGVFTILSHDMFKGECTVDVVKAASALEINQSGLLIHDDIMDNDELRRGEQSMFAAFREKARKRDVAKAGLYGTAAAILGGDVAFFLSYKILSHMKHKNTHRIVADYADEMLRVSIGQSLDMEYGETSYEPNKEKILNMYALKTAGYTFDLPFLVGGSLANIDKKTVKKLYSFTHPLGILFQIKDDELSLFGDRKTTGKPVGSDIRENKKTLARFFLFKNATPIERKKMQGIFGAKVNDGKIAFIQAIYDKHEIAAHISDEVLKLAEESKTALSKLPVDSLYKDMLYELVEFSVSRGK